MGWVRSPSYPLPLAVHAEMYGEPDVVSISPARPTCQRVYRLRDELDSVSILPTRRASGNVRRAGCDPHFARSTHLSTRIPAARWAGFGLHLTHSPRKQKCTASRMRSPFRPHLPYLYPNIWIICACNPNFGIFLPLQSKKSKNKSKFSDFPIDIQLTIHIIIRVCHLNQRHKMWKRIEVVITASTRNHVISPQK